jgi:replicative DNA helicase
MTEGDKSYNPGGPKSFKTIKGDADYNSLQYGRIQPQAVPLEEAVLGAILIDKNALPTVLDILQPRSFYVEGHQHIYEAMLRLFEKTHPIDILTVHEELKSAGHLDKVGGPNYLVELSNRVASAANIEYHARIIAQKHIQRELIQASTTIIKDSFDDTKDVFELLDDAERNLFEITQQNLNRGFEAIGSLAIKAQKQLEELSQKSEGLTGVPSGFTELDRLTSGWQSSDLIIVAARPGMGKTAYTLSLAKNAAMDYGRPVALFSLEMSSIQLVQRLISMEAEISSRKLRNGQLEPHEWQQLHTAVEKLSTVPIYIDDTPAINSFELRAKCRRLKMQHDIQLVIIDYLQLMSGSVDNKKSGTREQEISSISRAMKGMAKELGIPVIALSQLSRAVETRGGEKRPMLSDLRESGAIEQDADIVSFIYRPEYYDITESEGVSLKGVAEIIIAKHRNGALETVKLKFIDQFAKFANLDEFDFSSLKGDDFAAQGGDQIMTRPSRMNQDDDIPF